MDAKEIPQSANHPTISERQDPPFEKINTEFPLSYGQEALYFIQQLSPDSTAHNIVYAIRIQGTINMAAFKRAYRQLANRHPSLRTTFGVKNGQTCQFIHNYLNTPIQLIDARGWPKKQLDAELRSEIFKPFDLISGPLVRIQIFQQAPHLYLLLIAMHHIITDMWSMAIFIDEITKLYQMEIGGEVQNMPEPRGKYQDYVHSQRTMLEGEHGEKLWGFWRKKLSGDLPALNLTTDYPRPPVQTDHGAAAGFCFNSEQTAALRSFAKQNNTSLHAVVLAAFQILLHRCSGQSKILIGYPKFGRKREMARVIGYFINPIVLCSEFSQDQTFLEFLEQSQQALRETSDFDEYPFMSLVERLQPTRDISRSPLIQTMFAWQKTTKLVERDYMTSFALSEEGKAFDFGNLIMEPVSLPYRVVPFDLTMLAAETEKELEISIEYNSDLFNALTIEDYLLHFQALLESILDDPDMPVSKLNILTQEEKKQLLQSWNPAPVERDMPIIQNIIENQARLYPQKTAVVLENNSITYQQMNERANQIAYYLQKSGVCRNQTVGIFLERSLDMIIGLLGILKSGAAYLPLDPHFPAQRLEFMLQDADAKIVLTKKQFLEQIPEIVEKALCLDSDWPAVSEMPINNPEHHPAPQDLAYILYTSGSTGTPKGVMVPYESIANHCVDMMDYYQLTPEDRILQFASLNFDPSLEQILPTLMAGARLILRGEDLWEPDTFHEKALNYGLSIINLTPAYWHQLVQIWADSPEKVSALPIRLVIIGGDVMRIETVELWRKTPMKTVRLLNAYGPTEATITATTYEVPQEDTAFSKLQKIPIGKPLRNRQAFILDANGNPQPAGIPGELCLGGCLAAGYIHHPKLTNEKFISHPFQSTPGSKLYRTGDLTCFHRDGNIDFLGRIDHQIKIRGIRIELGEIESTLTHHPDLREVFIDVIETSENNERLIAYCVARSEEIPSPKELQQWIKTRLPAYMLPSAFIFLKELPLNTSGKVNRRALPSLQDIQAELGETHVPPSTPLEKELAKMWSKVLHVENIGIHDNFFDLGGHSLLATQLIARTREIYHVNLPLRNLFEQPTISGLAENITHALVIDQKDSELSQLLDELENLPDNEIQDLIGKEDQIPG